jgi:hypothetical protein
MMPRGRNRDRRHSVRRFCILLLVGAAEVSVFGRQEARAGVPTSALPGFAAAEAAQMRSWSVSQLKAAEPLGAASRVTYAEVEERAGDLERFEKCLTAIGDREYSKPTVQSTLSGAALP